MVARLHLFWDFGEGNTGRNTRQEEEAHLMARREEETGVLCSLQGHTPKNPIPFYSATPLKILLLSSRATSQQPMFWGTCAQTLAAWVPTGLWRSVCYLMNAYGRGDVE